MNDTPQVDKTVNECRRILEQCRQCPPADTLSAFHEDQLAPGDAAAVAAHLGSCPECAHLLEQFTMVEEPMIEDAAYSAALEEDRAAVAKTLGFRVERPPSRPMLERLSWLWNVRVPALVPACGFALLALVILWPAPQESPVTDFGRIVTITSDDFRTRSASAAPRSYQPPVDATLMIRHLFRQTPIDEGTMVSREIKGPRITEHLEPLSVVSVEREGRLVPCIEFPLAFHEAGTYYLRLSHPENAFAPVILKFEIQP